MPDTATAPFGLLAELTYACPLHCAYCSNPLNLGDYRDELTTDEWLDILEQARDLGVLQLHLSGGEPLQRHDIVEIVHGATDLGLYTNLITSALGLSRRRAERLGDAGLGHIQISVQDARPALSDHVAGTPSFDRKLAAAQLVKELGWPLTLNVVLHRHNIDHLSDIVQLAERLDADRLELANTQYYGWALHNRAALLPTKTQVENAERTVRAVRDRVAERMEIVYVLPDYYSDYPKPCMGGWAKLELTVTPNGDALPCPAAHTLPLPRASTREHTLDWIWSRSPLFQAFRGTDWMSEPCRSCPRATIDHGGCRCQAYALTGDATRTDPVCVLSPDHHLVEEALNQANDPRPRRGFTPRPHPSQTG